MNSVSEVHKVKPFKLVGGASKGSCFIPPVALSFKNKVGAVGQDVCLALRVPCSIALFEAARIKALA